MEAVRTFIIRNKRWCLGLPAVILALLCLGMVVKILNGSEVVQFLLGILLCVLSVRMIINEAEDEFQRGRWLAACILLGCGVGLFPMAAAVIPFYLEICVRGRSMAKGMALLLIPAGMWIAGVRGILEAQDVWYPIHHLAASLNTENVFDFNPSFWALVTGREQLRFGMVAALMGMVILILGIYLYAECGADRREFLCWTVWTCLLFMPYGQAEDGLLLVVILLLYRPLGHRMYYLHLFFWLAETLLMLGSAYGGYELLGYSMYQMLVGMNLLLWFMFSYEVFSAVWKRNEKSQVQM